MMSLNIEDMFTPVAEKWKTENPFKMNEDMKVKHIFRPMNKTCDKQSKKNEKKQ